MLGRTDYLDMLSFQPKIFQFHSHHISLNSKQLFVLLSSSFVKIKFENHEVLENHLEILFNQPSRVKYLS